MTYRVYTTEGIVLETVPSGESSKYLWIYTQRFGRVGVRAKSLRKLESKLRFGLQPYALVEVSLVRGKSGWRLVGARPLENFYFALTHIAKQRVLVHLTNLIRRLVHGQEQNQELYSIIKNTFLFLVAEDLRGNNLRHLERLTVLRILHALGYLQARDIFARYTKDAAVTVTVVDDFSAHSEAALTEINQTLARIHL